MGGTTNATNREANVEAAKMTALMHSLAVSKPELESGSTSSSSSSLVDGPKETTNVEKDKPENVFDDQNIWGFDPFSQNDGSVEPTVSDSKENEDMSWATFGTDFKISGNEENSTKDVTFPSFPVDDEVNK